MYLDVVMVDFLAHHGSRTTYSVRPKVPQERVVIESTQDLRADMLSPNTDSAAAVTFLNLSDCTVRKVITHPQSFEQKEHGKRFSFQVVTKGVPVGPSRRGHGGMYNLMLPSGWRLTHLNVVDPMDERQEELKQKKPLAHLVLWDSAKEVQVVQVEMRSRWGSFSLAIIGEAVLVTRQDSQFINSCEGEWGFAEVSHLDEVSRGAAEKVTTEVIRLANVPHTGYRTVDSRLVELTRQLDHELPTLEASVRRNFLEAWAAVSQFAALAVQAGRYKGKEISEATFQADMRDHLRSVLGSDVLEGTRNGGGPTDLLYRGIPIELKVEEKLGDRSRLVEKYIKQPTQYASGASSQVALLAILDLSPKDAPPAVLPNSIILGKPPLHGFDVTPPLYETRVGVVVIDGNLKNPSDYSR